MNNLVKFLILSFLILWPASLNADSKPSISVKCDLERTIGRADVYREEDLRKRKLIIDLFVDDGSYYALQWVDETKDLTDFRQGGGTLSLYGDNDEFYSFKDLFLWMESKPQGRSHWSIVQAGDSLMTQRNPYQRQSILNRGLELWTDSKSDEALLEFDPSENIFLVQSLIEDDGGASGGYYRPRIHRETLELLDRRETKNNRFHKCILLNEKESLILKNEFKTLLKNAWTESLKLYKELKAKEQKEKEEQRERYKF
tara:strand:- start:123 stop:893 length:771 start_codon:yes stop_codon:yes gene_type:complete